MSVDPNAAKAIFMTALDRADPQERAAYLAQACAGDDMLRRRVDVLLKAHVDPGSFLNSPAAGPAATLGESIAERPDTIIGPYKLLQQIGEGGMGVVWMAEQTQPVHRKVALKVIKPGMDSRQVIARFEAERQALALMDHVNIARVFDGGATESGRPYFVMELVHGVPITKYCDDNHLTPRERLELFVPVCQAIQHAHQKGIIHRDVKPSNVMITLYDGKPVPKVIDFGVAKATEQKLTERTLFTQYGTMVGTLEYMSPEQAEMSALGVDTRSDIYSLGVLLYELLTGSTPLSRKRMKEAAFAEILRMIKEEEPPKPSTRLSDAGEELASISAQRHMEPAKLAKLVRGELDWIVMKCLEKDRNRRYETANGFAQDLQRYLADESVQACPPSAWYRFRKFARRNKRMLSTAALLTLALLLTVVVLAVSYIRVQRESEQKEEALTQARANFRKARAAVNRSFTRISESDLFDVTGLHPLRLQLLQDAIKYYRELADQQPDDPTLQAELAATYFRAWQVYASVDQGPASEDALRQALDIVDQLRREHPGNAEVLGILAAVQYGAEHFQASTHQDVTTALQTLRRGSETWAALAAENPAIPEFQRNLAEAYHEIARWHASILDTSEALRAAQQALTIWETLTREHPRLVNAGWEIPIRRAELAIHLGEGRLQEAVRISQEGIAFADEQARRNPTQRRYRIASANLNRRLGDILLHVARQPKEAEQPYWRAAALFERLADDYPGVPSYPQRVSDCYYGLAEMLRVTDRASEAEEMYGKSLQRLEKLRAAFPRSIDALKSTFYSKYRLAQLLAETGRPGEGEKAFREAVAFADQLVTQIPTAGHYAGDAYGVFGRFLETAGRLQEAEEVYRKSLTTFDKLAADMPEEPRHRFVSASAAILLGTLLQKTGRPAAAEKAYRRGLDLCEKLTRECPFQPNYRKYLLDVRRRLAALLSEQGHHVEAEQLARQALADWENLLSRYPGNSEFRGMLGDVYGTLSSHLLAASLPKEAEKLCRQAIVGFEKLAAANPTVPEYRTELARSHNRLGILLRNAGRKQEADVELRKAQELWRAHSEPELERLKKAAEADPKNGLHWGRLAIAYYRFGNWEASLEIFKTKGHLGYGISGSAWQWFYMAIVHWQLDHKEEAHSWYYQSIDWVERAQEKRLRAVQAEAAALMDLPDPGERSERAWKFSQTGTDLEKQGQKDKAKEAYGKAIGLYEQLLLDFPTVPVYRTKLVDLLTKTGRGQEAETEHRKVIAALEKLAAGAENAPELPDALARSHHTLAGLLVERKQPQEAIKAYRQAISIWEKLATDFADRPEFRQHAAFSYGQLAAVLKGSGEPIEAEKALRHAVNFFERLGADLPTVAWYRQGLGHHLWQLGALCSATMQPQEAEKAYRQAAAVFEKLSADFPKQPFFQQELGFTYYDFLGPMLTTAKRSREAEPAYRKAVTVHEKLVAEFPNGEYAARLRGSYVRLADSMQANGRIEDAEKVRRQAIEFFEKRATAKPKSAQYRQELGQLHIQFGQWDKTIKVYTEAIELKADGWEVWYYRGYAFHNLQQWDKAIADYSKAIERAPDVHAPLVHRAWIYLHLKKWDKAAADYAKVVEKWPDDFNSWYWLGFAHANLGQPDKAVAALRQAIAKGFKDVENMKKDPRIDSLRSREDFKKLLAELEGKKK